MGVTRMELEDHKREPPPRPLTSPPKPSRNFIHRGIPSCAKQDQRRNRPAQRLPWGEVRQNPVTGTPSRPTKQYRIRGNYSKAETQFLEEDLQARGYELTESNIDWDVIWTIRMFPTEYHILAPFQKVNFMPGLQVICRKDLLNRTITRFRDQHLSNSSGLTENQKKLAECAFWPLGYNLEEEGPLKQVEDQLQPTNGEPVPIFIIKKPFTSCGRGVTLVSSVEDLHQLQKDEDFSPFDKHLPLEQRYIKNVRLFDGFKFTMRVYVAITSVSPLRIFVFDNGLLRICSKRYSLDETSFQDPFVHIDSFAINIHNTKPEMISEDLSHEGLRCDIQTYFDMLDKSGEISKEELWRRVDEVVALSMIAPENDISDSVASTITQRSHAFEILGYDLLLDQDLNFWLLEINHTPSLSPHTELENQIKRQMIHDLFDLVDITAARKLKVKALSTLKWEVVQRLQEQLAAGETPNCFIESSALLEMDIP